MGPEFLLAPCTPLTTWPQSPSRPQTDIPVPHDSSKEAPQASQTIWTLPWLAPPRQVPTVGPKPHVPPILTQKGCIACLQQPGLRGLSCDRNGKSREHKTYKTQMASLAHLEGRRTCQKGSTSPSLTCDLSLHEG